MRIESFYVIFDAIHQGPSGLSGLWAVLRSIYQLPGNLLLEAVGNVPEVADLFHIQASALNGYDSLSGWFSNLSSLFFWLFIWFLLSGLKPER